MDTKKEDRGFKGIWIPKEVWINKNLTVMEKIALVEINSYDNDFGCVASNSTLSKSMNIKPNTFGNLIRSLESKGYIKTSYDDMMCYSGRVINVFKDKYFGIKTPPLENQEPPLENQEPPLENQEPPLENQEHSNTFSNTYSKSLNINAETSSAYVQPELFSSSEVKTKNKENGGGREKKMKPRIMNARQRIIEFWLKDFHSGWGFSAVDGKKIGSIISKLKKTLSDSGNDVTEDNVVNLFKSFCLQLDGFYKNETLSVLDSKYYTIIEKIKESKNGKSNYQIESNRNFVESINAFSHFDRPSGVSCEDNL